MTMREDPSAYTHRHLSDREVLLHALFHPGIVTLVLGLACAGILLSMLAIVPAPRPDTIQIIGKNIPIFCIAWGIVLGPFFLIVSINYLSNRRKQIRCWRCRKLTTTAKIEARQKARAKQCTACLSD